MQIPFILGGGGGDSSDDCTAEAADILKSKTAIYNGSDDDAANGSMEDYSGTTKSATASLDGSNSRVQMTIPDTGKYDTAAKLYTTYSNMRTLIGLTDASKFLSGTTILGLAGTMSDRSGTTSSATSSLDTSNSRLRLQIPSNGYYNTSSYLYQTYSNIASLIGLTAAKIKYGESILGITGTWNGYVATTSDLYYGGSVGSVGGSLLNLVTGSSGNSVTFDTSCIAVAGGSSATTYFGFSFSNAINTGAYSRITMTYQVVTVPSSTTPTIALSLYTSTPTTSNIGSSATLTSSATLSSHSTGRDYTLSIDLSSVSQTLYVAAAFRSYMSSSGVFLVNVTRIQLS